MLKLKWFAKYLEELIEFTVDDNTLAAVYDGHTIFSIFATER